MRHNLRRAALLGVCILSLTILCFQIFPESGNIAPHVSLPSSDDLGQLVLTKWMYSGGFRLSSEGICQQKKALKVLIAVTSAPSHREARIAARETWGSLYKTDSVAVAFVLGTTTNASLQRELHEEYEQYRDIVQANFEDSYDNLTLKSVAVLEWADRHCPSAAFVMKTDDDAFINVANLEVLVSEQAGARRSVLGLVSRRGHVFRERNSRYYLPPEQWLGSVLPDYAVGLAYLVTRDAVRDLYDAALAEPLVRIEDVFITGIVAGGLGLQLVEVAGLEYNLLDNNDPLYCCRLRRAVAIHAAGEHSLYWQWLAHLHTCPECHVT